MDPEIRTPVNGPDASAADAEHLKLLAIFHYIYAGLIACGGCCVSGYVLIGFLMVTGEMDGPDASPPELGWFFAGFGGCGMLFIWAIAALVALAGRSLQQRRNRIYCIIVAGVMCVNVPMGTALGVFTLIVLSRPSVKLLFGDA